MSIDWQWDKVGWSKFIDKVDFELQELRSHVERLDAELQQLIQGREGITREGREEQISSTTSETLMQATYAIRSTAIAMRGYLMLIDQMGLPRDAKRMIREIEYIMMMIMKLSQTIKLLQLAQGLLTVSMGDPRGLLYLFLAGGYGMAGIAYANKTMGGTV